jgi:hypothetical protein
MTDPLNLNGTCVMLEVKIYPKENTLLNQLLIFKKIYPKALKL